MPSLKNNEYGILIRGRISDWTKDIVQEYEQSFPDSKIIVSTWSNENTDDISCTVIKSEEIDMPYPHRSTINHQVILAKNGLKHLNTEIIMVCRSDQFIHNENIFKIFKNDCPKNKILVSTFPGFLHGTPDDYRYTYGINDMCQIGKNELLHNFWDHVLPFDGSRSISVARTLTENYIVNVNKDKKEWPMVKNDYFYERDYYQDFLIEWKRYMENRIYRESLDRAMKKFQK